MSYYDGRIETAIAFMETHYSKALKLQDLAESACFSVYHFTRIFQLITGTTPMKYLKGIRLRNARSLLLQTDMAITEVALSTGFGSISNFNAAVKERFGVAPGDLRAGKKGNVREDIRNTQEAEGLKQGHTLHKSLIERVWNMNVTVKDFPPKRAAYFRHTGSYLETGGNWQKLLAWVGSHGLFRPGAEFIGISLDDPETTEEDECRHDACITLPEGFNENAHSGASYQTLPGGLYAVYRYYDTIDKLLLSFRSLYLQWLPESGYEADDRPVMEINLNNPAEDPEHKTKCDICIPVKLQDRSPVAGDKGQ